MTPDVDTTHIIGNLRRLDDKRGAVRMETVYDTDIGDLWSAVTEPDRLTRWIATIDGEARVGATVQTQFTSSWAGPVRIDVCTAPRHLVVTLDPDSDDEAVVEAFLTAEGDRTRLVVEDRGLPLDVLHLHGAGWQAHLEDLHHHLSGAEPSAWKPRWEQLTPDYQACEVQ
jgi:uncharacterized protein YndB with AHSA1/START domain